MMDNDAIQKVKEQVARETEAVFREVETLFDTRDFYLERVGDWFSLKFTSVLGYQPLWKFEPLVRYNLKLKMWESRIGKACFFTSGCPFFEFICELRGYTLPGTVSEDAVVLDAGPWNGISGMYFSAAAAKGKVIFLEPDAESADFIAAEIERNQFQNASLVRKALYVRDGEIGFQHRERGASHIDVTVSENRVRTVSLRDLIKEHAPQGINYFKMDIEGIEVAIADDLGSYISDNPGAWAAIASYHKVNGVRSFVALEKVFSRHPKLVFKTAYPYHQTTFVAHQDNDDVVRNFKKITQFEIGCKAIQAYLKRAGA